MKISWLIQVSLCIPILINHCAATDVWFDLHDSVLPAELLQEAIPGNIRRAEHFTAFLARFVEYLKVGCLIVLVASSTKWLRPYTDQDEGTPRSCGNSFIILTTSQRYHFHRTQTSEVGLYYWLSLAGASGLNLQLAIYRFCAERLSSLVRTLQLTRIDEYSALQKVAAFATLVSTYHEGFRLLLEPFETDNATVPNPVFHLVCLDASLAIKPVFERFSSVVITSGTLSPLDMYPRMLGFEATVLESYVMTLTRDCFLPLVRPPSFDACSCIEADFESGSDCTGRHSRFRSSRDFIKIWSSKWSRRRSKLRYSPRRVLQSRTGWSSRFLPELSLHGEYRQCLEWNGESLVSSQTLTLSSERLSKAFRRRRVSWTKYSSTNWSLSKLPMLSKLLLHLRTIAGWARFSFSLCISPWLTASFRSQACDNGRGACLLSVARGKVSEGIDFDHNYGRAVIMFGIPYQVRSRLLRSLSLSLLIDRGPVRTVHWISYPQSSIGILEGHLSNQGERFLDFRCHEACCAMCWTCTAR